MYSPNVIEVLIHYCCSTRRHERQDAPAVANACNQLCNDGMLEPYLEPYHVESGPYRATEGGRLYLQMLCEVPPPRQMWVDHNGKILTKKE